MTLTACACQVGKLLQQGNWVFCMGDTAGSWPHTIHSCSQARGLHALATEAGLVLFAFEKVTWIREPSCVTSSSADLPLPTPPVQAALQ